MSIVFHCDGCGRRFEVNAGLTGKKFRCKHCDRVSRVPAGAGSASATAAGTGPAGFDPFGLDEADAPKVRPAAGGDGLVGEPLVTTFAPSPSGPTVSEDVNPSRGIPVLRKKRKPTSEDESPVLGVPMGQAPWVFLGGLAFLNLADSFLHHGVSRWGVIVGFVALSLHLVLVVVNAAVMLVACRLCDAEVSSIRRLLSIALAIAAATTVVSTVLQYSAVRSPVIGLVVNLIVSGSILSATLQLGCLGVIGFLFVEFVAYAVLFLFLNSLLTGR